MTQFEHNVIAMVLLFATAYLFKDYFFYPKESEFWEKKFSEWFN